MAMTMLDPAFSTVPSKSAEIRFHAVVYQNGEWWVGACLEHSIGSQARTREAIFADLKRMVQFHLRWAEKEGAEPFASLPSAPKSFWDRYRSGPAERIEVVIHAEHAVSATVELRAA